MDENPLEPFGTSQGDELKPPSSKDQKKAKLYKNGLIALGAITVVLLIAVLIFASRAFINDDKLAQANKEGQVAGAAAQKSLDEKAFALKENSDLKVYTAPATAGSFQVSIPKSWSLMITPDEGQNTISGKAMPDYVDTKLLEYALRFNLVEKNIEDVKKDYDALTKGNDPTKRKANIEEVTVSGVKGFRYSGQIAPKIPNGTITIFPLRDKTFTIQTDNNAKYIDIYNAIVGNLSLNP